MSGMIPSDIRWHNAFEPLEQRVLLSGGASASLGSYEASTPPTMDGSSLLVQLGEGAARGVQYRDSDGTGVTVAMRKGWASLALTGDGLHWSVRRGTVYVDGDDVALADILLRDTGRSSQLKIQTDKAGDGVSTLGGLFGSTPLGKLSAAGTDLVGEGIVLSGAGTIGTVMLGDVSNGADVVLPSAAGRGVRFFAGRIGDGSDVRVGSALRALRVGEWLDGDSEADLVTSRIDRLWVAGDFWADMMLTGFPPAGKTLGKVRIGGGRISSGWAVTGRVGPVVVRGGTFVGEGLAVGAPADASGDMGVLAAGSSALGWELYHAMVADPTAGNVLFSPLSVSMALSMAYAGAAGETAAQIAAAARFGLEGDRIPMGMGELIRRLDPPGGPAGAFDVFNGVWAQDVGSVQLRYAELLAHYYGAELGVVDFRRNPRVARNSINTRVRTLTGGAIPALFGPGGIDRSTTLALASTIACNVEWEHPFSDTGDWTFTSLDGGQKRISMMSQRWYFDYAEEGTYQAVQVDMKGGSQTMLIILPAEGEFENVQAQLSEDMIDDVYGRLRHEEVDLKIPRFQARCNAELAPALRALGISDAFDPQAADFSGIAAGGLSLDAIAHLAMIEMAEKAVGASTSTAAAGRLQLLSAETASVEIHLALPATTGELIPPKRFIADRPFIYVIRDSATGATLFVGRVTEAAGQGFESEPTGAPSPPLYEGTVRNNGVDTGTISFVHDGLFQFGVLLGLPPNLLHLVPNAGIVDLCSLFVTGSAPDGDGVG